MSNAHTTTDSILAARGAGHTPGPWMYLAAAPFKNAFGDFVQWGEYRVSANSLDAEDEDYYRIGSVSNANDGSVNEANARLIAAAPDMLLALRRAALALAFAAESSEAMRDDYEAVGAAIKKATGEQA